MKAIGVSVLAVVASCHSEQPRTCSDLPGTACSWAGTPGVQGQHDDVRDRRDSILNWPSDIGFSPDGRGYIVDWNNHEVRRVEADDTLTTVLGNAIESEGAADGTDFLPPTAPLGAPGTTVSLNHPTSVDFLPDGNVVVASWHGLRIRVWEPESGLARVIAGDGQYGSTGDGGEACRVEFNLPRSVVADATGHLYVLDQKNQRIRTFDSSPTAIVTTFAGTGIAGFSGDGGLATDAQLAFVTAKSLPSGGLAIDGEHLFIADSGNNRIRRVDLATHIIDTIAGNGTAGYTGDGGAGTSASLANPGDLAIGPDGRLYIADASNNVIRRLDLATGVIDTVVGTGAPCSLGTSCVEAADGGPARDVLLNGPLGIGFDAAGNLYIADTYNDRIVRVARDW